MTFDEPMAQVLELLQCEGRVSCRALKRRFALAADYLEDLKAAIIDAKRLAVDEDGKVLVWKRGPIAAGVQLPVANLQTPTPSPQSLLSYTPRHLAEKILTSRSALEGERKHICERQPLA